jgi:hypothetical protein
MFTSRCAPLMVCSGKVDVMTMFFFVLTFVGVGLIYLGHRNQRLRVLPLRSAIWRVTSVFMLLGGAMGGLAALGPKAGVLATLAVVMLAAGLWPFLSLLRTAPMTRDKQ